MKKENKGKKFTEHFADDEPLGIVIFGKDGLQYRTLKDLRIANEKWDKKQSKH